MESSLSILAPPQPHPSSVFSDMQLNKMKSSLILFLIRLAQVYTGRHGRIIQRTTKEKLDILAQVDWGRHDAAAVGL